MPSIAFTHQCCWIFGQTLVAATVIALAGSSFAQTAPSSAQIMQYSSFHKAAHEGDVARIDQLAAENADIEARDDDGRTALHVAAFQSNHSAIIALAKAGANMNALENSAYDVVTIAAVANDIATLEIALKHGASAANVTSPYDGTALIAAAHLGHHQVVKILIAAKAPIDHVNNLGWTALIEAVVLGDGGIDHLETVRALVAAGADKTIADRNGLTPLQHAIERGYSEMVAVLSK